MDSHDTQEYQAAACGCPHVLGMILRDGNLVTKLGAIPFWQANGTLTTTLDGTFIADNWFPLGENAGGHAGSSEGSGRPTTKKCSWRDRQSQEVLWGAGARVDDQAGRLFRAHRAGEPPATADLATVTHRPSSLLGGWTRRAELTLPVAFRCPAILKKSEPGLRFQSSEYPMRIYLHRTHTTFIHGFKAFATFAPLSVFALALNRVH